MDRRYADAPRPQFISKLSRRLANGAPQAHRAARHWRTEAPNGHPSGFSGARRHSILRLPVDGLDSRSDESTTTMHMDRAWPMSPTLNLTKLCRRAAGEAACHKLSDSHDLSRPQSWAMLSPFLVLAKLSGFVVRQKANAVTITALVSTVPRIRHGTPLQRLPARNKQSCIRQETIHSLVRQEKRDLGIVQPDAGQAGDYMQILAAGCTVLPCHGRYVRCPARAHKQRKGGCRLSRMANGLGVRMSA